MRMILGGQNYLVFMLVGGGRYPVKLIEVCASWLRHHGSQYWLAPFLLLDNRFGTLYNWLLTTPSIKLSKFQFASPFFELKRRKDRVLQVPYKGTGERVDMEDDMKT
ncbi:hypothetical protein H5410_013781 [Solanum commersonii]|uniref:Uncharacterized protein n=1 Tax=Solanum commersonii TaxID=4109 RepID=A0A9J5ZP38_SOLCO|nr:hypothetical protein H5410_013781 [Solanum commersonii]